MTLVDEFVARAAALSQVQTGAGLPHDVDAGSSTTSCARRVPPEPVRAKPAMYSEPTFDHAGGTAARWVAGTGDAAPAADQRSGDASP
jgi:hypothetical protein